MFTKVSRRVVIALLVGLIPAAASGTANGQVSDDVAQQTSAPSYELQFTVPPAEGGEDLTLEDHFIQQLSMTPAGARVLIAQTVISRMRIAQAIVAAYNRGVDIQIVLHRASNNEPATQLIRAGLPAGSVTACGETIGVDSCIVTPVGTVYGMHNRFWTISEMTDGSTFVSTTSAGQFNNDYVRNHNDLVVVRNDPGLFDAYNRYWADLKAQVRTDSYYRSEPIANGNVYFLPRRRALPDPVAEILPDLDCNAPGGAPDGKGLVRFGHNVAAQQRLALANKLIEYAQSGCTVEYTAGTWDANVQSWLIGAGVNFIRVSDQKTASGVPVGIIAKAHWIDATTKAGQRLKRAYLGSAELNFLGNYALDDQFIEVNDQGVVNGLNAWFEILKARAVFRPNIVLPDRTLPNADGRFWPRANAAGWVNSDVTVTMGGGEAPNGTGVAYLEYQLSGATTTPVTRVDGDFAKFAVSNEGITTVSLWAVDKANNVSVKRSLTIRIDKTAPTIDTSATPPPNAAGWNNTDVTVAFSATDSGSGLTTATPRSVTLTAEGAGQVAQATFADKAGNSTTATYTANIDKTDPVLSGMPADSCSLWPPDGELVQVASVEASDALSGVGSFAVTGSSDEPQETLQAPDVVIDGGTVRLRAERLGTGDGRTYTLDAGVTDLASNSARQTTTCVVSHDLGHLAANAQANADRRLAAAAERETQRAAGMAAAAELAAADAAGHPLVEPDTSVLDSGQPDPTPDDTTAPTE
ncbi:MAG TPA: hypothetical protein VEK80_04515 [Kribbellaceae bacterium]|nr:hypothetical protein [Kribbellaceae bacterium]